MAEKEKMVSVIVLNWNGWGFLNNCLKSIKKNTVYGRYEVILVDNGSEKKDVENIKKAKKKGLIDRVIYNKENKGFAFANNQGFEIAKGDYYYMLNNDTQVTRGWLKEAVKKAESDEGIGAVGSRLVQDVDFEKGNFKTGADREVLTTCGAAMLMKKSVVKEIGVLDAGNFSPIYGEETDWCYRARRAGYKIVETDKSRVVHYGSVDTKRQTGKEWQYTLMNENRIKAMLYNLGPLEFARHIPGLGLIFVQSIRDGMFLFLLKSYWRNMKNLGHTLEERRKRVKGKGRI